MEPARIRASPEQISALIEYMERHGDLSRPQAGSQGRLKSMQLWAELTAILNSMGSGVERSQDRWKKIWADWKNKAKKKLMNIRRQANATGGGPSCRLSLTAMEIRIVHIIGEAAVVGQRGVQEHGFNTQSQPIEENPQQGGAEIVVELQDFNLVSPSIPPPPPAPTPPLLPSSLSPLLPPPPPPRTSPRRTQHYSSPRSVTSTPRRQRQRMRRSRGLTPFDRAASEFAAIERQRLQFEEARENRLHEREMEQLRVESERTQALVNNTEMLQRMGTVMERTLEMCARIVTQFVPRQLS